MSKRRFRYSPSIGTRILISHVALCVIVIALVSMLSYAIASRSLKVANFTKAAKTARLIAENTPLNADGSLAPDSDDVQLWEKLTRASIFFVGTGEDARRVWHPVDESNADEAEALKWSGLMDYIERALVDRVLAGEEVSTLQHFGFSRDSIMLVGVPVTGGDGAVRGAVILTKPVEQQYRLSRIIGFIVSFTLLASLLLSAVLAVELTHILVRPIKRITTAARHMEAGVYAESIQHLPNDEIGELGYALNSMSAKLVDVIGSLRKERDKLELVMSGIGEGLIAVDTQWNIVHANAVFLELTETDSASAFLEDEERFAPLRELLERCMRDGSAERLEWVNASKRPILARAAALKDEHGVILGAVCLMSDVSEVERLEQLRRDYVANISHELRTPLTGIRGMVEPLIDGCMVTEEERMDSYRVILKETMRLEKLVGEMLDMSRLQDGRQKVEVEPLELPGILEAAVRSMKKLAVDAGVDLRVETDGSRLACLGNEDRIMQVLVILIDNAISFTPRGGSVVVFGTDGAQYVSAGVRDTGCGIEPKDLPLIWERFYKADKSRMGTTGTGLGLSIARLVVELMGGTICVKSEPGQGAEFTFTLKKIDSPQ